jgi:hypothetical protein
LIWLRGDQRVDLDLSSHVQVDHVSAGELQALDNIETDPPRPNPLSMSA